jgi:DNA polymerase-1
MDKLYIIDAVNFLFRAYYAIGALTNSTGESTNALYGFVRTLFKLIRDFSPKYLVSVFDGPDNKSTRKMIYQEYKSHRARAPEDLYPQLDLAMQFCSIAGIPYLSVPNVEADDTMGSIAQWASEQGVSTYLCTGDKDLCQLVNDKIHILNVHKNNCEVDAQYVKEVFGVLPTQIVDLLALMGDTSDNIPGVAGIGAKTAAALITEFGSLDVLLDNLDKIKSEKKRQLLEEGRGSALISKRLAQLQLDISFPKEAEFFLLRKPDSERLKEFYQRFSFSSLLRELAPEEVREPTTPTEYQIVDTESGLMDLLQKLCQIHELAIHLETTDPHPFLSRIVGIALSSKEREGWYIPCNGKLTKERVLALLSPLFASSEITWIGHNMKEALHALANEGVALKHQLFDTMIASYLLSPHTASHTLELLSLEHFNIHLSRIGIDKGMKEGDIAHLPVEEVGRCSCEAVDYTFRLFHVLSKAISENGRSQKNLGRETVYRTSSIFLGIERVLQEVELPLIPILFSMERSGITLDRERLQQFSEQLTKEIGKIEQEIFSLAGESFNVNSPKQLSNILFEKMQIKGMKKTTTGYSTNSDVLEAIRDRSPIIPKIQHHRILAKLRSTYTNALLEAQQADGKIHCTFNQSVTATGRLSCQSPNLQNIPIRTEEGITIRKAFVPSQSDFVFLAADYSQIELRLLAHYSEDPLLLSAFLNREDVHKATAAHVFRIPLSAVTEEMRYQAKSVNFGILYGQSPFGLAQQIGISQQEAADFITLYFVRYPKVKEFIERCKEAVRRDGYAMTMFGRKRPIPDINSSNALSRSAAERLAVNTPLQGTAADLIKLAMITSCSALQRNPTLGSLLLQIHDELLFETPKNRVDALGELAREAMEGVCSLKVPLVVDISIGKNWGEC